MVKISAFRLACLVALVGLSVHAETFTAIAGRSDWNNPESFTVNDAPATRTPGASDTIYLNANATWAFTNDTAGAAAFNVMANVKEIRYENWRQAKLEVTVPSGTADIKCVIGPSYATRDTSLYKFCDLYKYGAGTLRFVCDGSYYLWGLNTCIWNIYTSVHVMEGIVRFFPDAPVGSSYIGMLEVAEGAKVYLPNKAGSGFTFQLRGLIGAGTIANDQTTTAVFDSMPQNKENTYAFSGTFVEESTGLLQVRWSGPQSVTGGKSANVGTTKIWSNGGAFTTLEIGNYGVTVTDQLGLMGQASSLGASEEINFQWLGGALWYNGAGETTDKQYTFSTPTEDKKIPHYFSAGDVGGVTFDGSNYNKTRWYSNGGAHDARVVLAGNNVNPMRVKCPVVSGAENQSLYFLKRGSGAWSFENDTKTSLMGSFAIEEGAIRFTSLDETGYTCALGKATRLHTFLDGQQTIAALDATLGSPFAVTLCATSAVTRGALEYTGTRATGASDRRTGLSGFGGKIVNNGQGPLLLNDVTAAAAGSTALVVGGANADDNVICNVTNGVGSIALIKEGAGKWTISHNVDVSSVEVKGGTLVLEKTTGKSYSWFKFYMMEARNWNLDGSGSLTTNAWPCIEEFILQDAEGNRVFTQPTSYDVATGGETSAQNWRLVAAPVNCHGIGPNSIAYGARGEVRGGGYNSGYGLDDRLATNLFDNVKSKSSAGFWPGCWNGVYTGPMRDRPASWPTVIMRLPADAPHVDACDLVAGTGGGWQNELYAWGLDGSRDGIHWETITNYLPSADTEVRKTTQHRAGNEYWSLVDQYGRSAADKTRWTAGQTKALVPNGYHFPGVVTSSYVFPTQLANVAVSGGGTLKIDAPAGQAPTIKSLTIDALTGGTILNGKYATGSAGTIDIVNTPKGKLNIPGKFAGLNLEGWTVKINGETARRRVVCNEQGQISVQLKGFVIVVE